jgi:hypothetical protein
VYISLKVKWINRPESDTIRKMSTGKGVKDVPPEAFIKAFAAHLKKTNKVRT